MAKFRWLHFSDLHWGTERQKEHWTSIRDDLFRDLRDVSQHMGGVWDAVFFTGDLVQRGDKSELFQELDQELALLWDCFNDLGANPVLLAVPGNHDLARPTGEHEAAARALIADWHKDKELQQEVLQPGPGSVYRRTIDEAFDAYLRWSHSGQRPFRRPTSLKKGLLPGDFAATLQNSGWTVGVVGLNTAFLQLREENFEGKLALSPRQVLGLPGEDYSSWLRKHDICLMLTHHPFTWLHDNDRRDFYQDVYRKDLFAAHLCGHCHIPRQDRSSVNGSSESHVLVGCSLFGRERFTVWPGKEVKDRVHGYLAGEIDLDQNPPRLRIWPRLSFPEDGLKRRLKAPTNWALNSNTSATEPVAVQPARPRSNISATTGPGEYQVKKHESGQYPAFQWPDPMAKPLRIQDVEPDHQWVATWRQSTVVIDEILRPSGDSISHEQQIRTSTTTRKYYRSASPRQPSIRMSIQLGLRRFVWFEDLQTDGPEGVLTVDPLITPLMQRSFILLDQHRAFLDSFDASQWYCFRAVEKCGKGSWLGHIAAHLLESEGGTYAPVWVGDVQEEGDVTETLRSEIEDLLRQKPDRKPALLIDDLHKKPHLIQGLVGLCSWLKSAAIPVYCTYLQEMPEDTAMARSWRDAENQWEEVQQAFTIVLDLPKHPRTSDGDRALTDDGRALREAVSSRLGEDIASALDPVLTSPDAYVPVYFVSAFVVENYGKPLEEYANWVALRQSDVKPEALFRRSWEGSELHQDILRTVAYLEQATPDLVVQFCTTLRGEDDQEPIRTHLAELRRLKRLRDRRQRMPFTNNEITTLEMLDGLAATARRPENFSPATERRYWTTLLTQVRPGTDSGELAALLARFIGRETAELAQQLLQRMKSQDWSGAGCAYLYELMVSLLESDAAVSPEEQNLLLELTHSTRPSRLVADWAKMCFRLWAAWKDNAQPRLDEYVTALGQLLQEEWRDGEQWREAGELLVALVDTRDDWREGEAILSEIAEDDRDEALRVIALLDLDRTDEADAILGAKNTSLETLTATAYHFQDRCGDSQRALELWSRISEEFDDYREPARARQLTCLLELGRDAEADALLAAEDASLDVLIAGAVFFHDNREDWERALRLHLRIAEQSEQHRETAQGKALVCLLELGRDAEANTILEPEDVPLEVLIAGAVLLHEKRQDWAHALDLWSRISERSAEHRPIALAKRLTCLLELGRDAEANAILEDEDAPLDVLIAGARFFHEKRQDWASALKLWSRIDKRSTKHREAAQGKEMACLLELGRDEEANAILEGEEVLLEPTIAAAIHYQDKRKDWVSARRLWHRIAERSVAHREAAREKEMICLLELGHDDEAHAILEEENASAEMLSAAAVHYQEKRQDWERARKLWHRLAERHREHRETARGRELICLLELSRFAEADALFEAESGSLEMLIAATLFYYDRQKDWETSLGLWRRIAEKSSETQVTARAGELTCLLELGRNIEAESMLEAENASLGFLIAGANFHEKQNDWERALPLHRRIGERSAEHRETAQGKTLVCLLELGRDTEADELLSAEDTSLNLLISAAIHYHDKRGDWQRALALHRRIGQRSAEYRETARGKELFCLLELGRDSEAARIIDDKAASPELLIVAALHHHDRRKDWERARELWSRIAEVSPEQREAAQGKELTCLLELGRDTEADAVLGAENASLEVLFAGANHFHDGRKDWQRALELWSRIAERSDEHRAAAQGKCVSCLFELNRATEAHAMLEADDAPLEVLFAGAVFYHERCQDWERALPLHRRIGMMSSQYREGARALQLTCLLELGRDVEAGEMLAAESPSLELLVAGATHYQERRKDPEKALMLWRRIAELSPEQRDAALARMLTCLLELGRDAEANAMLEPEQTPTSLLIAAANHHHDHRKDWERALSLWSRIAELSPEHHDAALAKSLTCLLNLGRDADAAAMLVAEDAPLEVLIAGADHYADDRKNWEKALEVWTLIGARFAQHRELAQGKRLMCLFELNRDLEAQAMLEADDTSLELLIAGAKHYHEHRKDWEKALRLWARVAERSTQHREVVRGLELTCLLELGRDAEAEAMLEPKDTSLELLKAAAIHYHDDRKDWQRALTLHRRIAERSPQHRETARGKELACLLKLGRDTEADALLTDESVSLELLIAAANHYHEDRRDWERALTLWSQIAERSPQHRPTCRGLELTCLLELGRDTQVLAMLELEDTPLDLLVAAANYYHERRNDWERALALHRRIAEQSPQYREIARGKELSCLLELGWDAEAHTILEAENASVETLIEGASFYHTRRQDWQRARRLWSRIGQISDEHSVAARANELTCLLELGRTTEADAMLEADEVSAELFVAAAIFGEKQGRWAESAEWFAKAFSKAPEDVNALIGLIKALIARDDWDRIEHEALLPHLNRLVTQPCESEGLGRRREAWARLLTGDFTWAFETTTRLLAEAEDWELHRVREVFLQAACLLGDVDAAIKTVNEMVATPDPPPDWTIMPQLVRNLASRHAVELSAALDSALEELAP